MTAIRVRRQNASVDDSHNLGRLWYMMETRHCQCARRCTVRHRYCPLTSLPSSYQWYQGIPANAYSSCCDKTPSIASIVDECI